jgi:hypothetical protein
LRFTYGHKVQDENDILVPLAEEVMNITGKLVSPNRYAVDVFPFCKLFARVELVTCLTNEIVNSLPEAFPGTGFKAVARKNREVIESLFTIPFLKVKEQVVRNIALDL